MGVGVSGGVGVRGGVGVSAHVHLNMCVSVSWFGLHMLNSKWPLAIDGRKFYGIATFVKCKCEFEK